ncbi:MAG: hypothetical protein D3924_01005 [Candidatus Electrothrix sp. AR4]|nr:hypothetical protein [Candidatus Electrothrix sp. AR4]
MYTEMLTGSKCFLFLDKMTSLVIHDFFISIAMCLCPRPQENISIQSLLEKMSFPDTDCLPLPCFLIFFQI